MTDADLQAMLADQRAHCPIEEGDRVPPGSDGLPTHLPDGREVLYWTSVTGTRSGGTLGYVPTVRAERPANAKKPPTP